MVPWLYEELPSPKQEVVLSNFLILKLTVSLLFGNRGSKKGLVTQAGEFHVWRLVVSREGG